VPYFDAEAQESWRQLTQESVGESQTHSGRVVRELDI
jgi:hypothetical protein